MTNKNSVWAVFVGTGGCWLPNFNSQIRQYPPAEADIGYVSIGWGNTGSMLMYQNNYKLFEEQFFKVYPNESTIQANEVFRFAFEIAENDFVISPSAKTGYVLVGKVIGSYMSDFDSEFKFEYYRHIRKVQWLYIIPKNDPRYSDLNRVGQLTVAKLKRTIEEVQAICETK